MKLRKYSHQTPHTHPRIQGLLSGLLLLGLGGCAPQTGQETEVKATQPVEVKQAAAPVRGEVPADLMEKILTALAEEENLDQADITVIRAESVIWPDGSLGCAKPGEMYTMAQVEGYWVVLQSGNEEFDYRATSSGQFHRCRNLFKVQNPVG